MSDDGFTVYLVGAINHGDGVNWWDEAEEELDSLGFDVVKPFDCWEFGPEDDYTVLPENGTLTEGTSHVVYDDEVLENNKDAVVEADVLLVGWDMTRRTRGTMAEIVYAKEGLQSTPVVLWMRKAEEREELDPAPRYYSDSITPDLDTAVQIIETLRSV